MKKFSFEKMRTHLPVAVQRILFKVGAPMAIACAVMCITAALVAAIIYISYKYFIPPELPELQAPQMYTTSVKETTTCKVTTTTTTTSTSTSTTPLTSSSTTSTTTVTVSATAKRSVATSPRATTTTISTTTTTMMVTGPTETVETTPVTYNENEAVLLAKLIHLEAARTWEGRIYVGSVVINRMAYYDDTMSEIIYAPGQFTTASRLNKYTADDYNAAVHVLTNGSVDTRLFFFDGNHSDGKNHFYDIKRKFIAAK